MRVLVMAKTIQTILLLNITIKMKIICLWRFYTWTDDPDCMTDITVGDTHFDADKFINGDGLIPSTYSGELAFTI